MASASGPVSSASIPVEGSNIAAANSLSELAHSVKEKGLWIFGESDSKRRVITIEKKDGSYGFTLQSYGVRYKHGNRETDFITYVNAVEDDGAAYHAGLREGDVILSINGQNMARVEHRSLVSFIRKCPARLKMVVISDERARKVELHMRYVHLQKKLQDKMNELEQLNKTEKEIMLGTFDGNAPAASSSNAVDFVNGACLPDAAASCCFCPTKSKSYLPLSLSLDAKEKSKSMGSSSATTNANPKQDLYYECYRKSQSTKELSVNTEQEDAASSSIIGIQASKRTSQSGGELSSTLLNTNSPSSAQITPAHGHSHGHSHTHHNHGLGPPCHNHAYQKSPTPISPNGTVETNNGSQNSSSSKPKSWDNLMTMKSFGGYGFGYGYGYYPREESGGGQGHHHFSHPHHHNHHTHCSSHPHSSYYYGGRGGKSSGSRRSSGDAAAASVSPAPYGESARPFTNYTTYKMVGSTGQTKIVARVNMNSADAAGCTRTLPSVRSSSSSNRQTPDTLSFSSAKLEKTFSDSSLNSEHHKDFPKSMSYFSTGGKSENDGQFSSDDEYDEYGTEPSYGPKNDIYV